MKNPILKSAGGGFFASTVLLSFYFGVLTLVSGRDFAFSQFSAFWYYIIALAFGFGLQIALFIRLKIKMRAAAAGGKIVAASGSASAFSMIACCAHYLVNLLPVAGIAGAASFVSRYQVQLFWLGLAFNLIGVMAIAARLRSPAATKE